MIKHLKGISIFAVGSKIYNTPFRGYDGQTESDLTRLKRGVRANSNLNWHEAFYRALDNARLLDTFQVKFPDAGSMNLVVSSTHSLKNSAHECEKGAKYYAGMAQQYGKDTTKGLYYQNASDEMFKKADAYLFLSKIEKEAETILDSLVKDRSKHIPWKDLQSVQFYVYDAQTNSFVETTEKG